MSGAPAIRNGSPLVPGRGGVDLHHQVRGCFLVLENRAEGPAAIRLGDEQKWKSGTALSGPCRLSILLGAATAPCRHSTSHHLRRSSRPTRGISPSWAMQKLTPDFLHRLICGDPSFIPSVPQNMIPRPDAGSVARAPAIQPGQHQDEILYKYGLLISPTGLFSQHQLQYLLITNPT